MNWYRVTKTTRGRKYDYWQRTYRVGKHVKTENKYIGPASRQSAPVPSSDQYERTIAEHRRLMTDMVPLPYDPGPPANEPKLRKADHSPEEWRELQRIKREEKREFDAGMKRQNTRLRATKKRTKLAGLKRLNPFIGMV